MIYFCLGVFEDVFGYKVGYDFFKEEFVEFKGGVVKLDVFFFRKLFNIMSLLNF